MNINIKATNTTLTGGIRSYIDEKLEPLEKFFREEDKVRVELEVDTRHSSGLKYRAEIDIQPRGLYADARANDFYEAWDLVIPKIKEQLVREKGKVIDKKRKEARSMKGKI